ncbi:hypothetical protein DFH94DRAFT_687333 [Russula ochroleuca]|uniref:DUF6535 domain-containing protein n=1 Tax=Russula ochroleuca TaxID=152965 RepID=A0A9P5N5K5_9AGAM|nr:hypothetical protein DFH94DRAFT_687333 [Russula ochroleuca]
MIGDFDGSANALWSLYSKESKSHDEARIQPLKDDMDGVLIFAGLFSASLTSFVVDSKQNLKVNPTDQMVYYLQQHSAILSQISQQISSIAPQVSIPSTPPPPFPPFNPSSSDVRINAFWFMALTFSLSAALLAILVQQWVRDYMHIFQRYSDPLKSARIRQYLYEGSERWYMPIAAEAVPALLHVSLFLFFVGLVDSTLNINTTIGLTTIVPIGLCGLLYIFTTFAPVIYPQSPYQTSFSGAIWYAIQKSRGRIFKDRDGGSKSVSTNMAVGQMQLSMEETKERKGRDKRAIRWLLDNLTEDAEIESFAMSIPGSFNGEWSFQVWTELSKFKEDNMPVVAEYSSRFRTIPDVLGLIPRQFRTYTASHSLRNAVIHRPGLHSAIVHRPMATTFTPERNTIHELCEQIAHLFDTCKNRAVFTSDELWRRRARACVEATASLLCYADVELSWFGDILGTLGDIGSFEGIRDLSLAEREQPFVVRWTCLSIMAIRPILNNNVFKEHARLAVESFEELRHSDRTDEAAEKNAREIDETLEDRWDPEFRWNFAEKIIPVKRTTEEIGNMETFDTKTVKLNAKLNERIDKVSLRITRQLPGVHFDFPDSESETFLQQSLELFRDPSKLRFISCRQSPNKFLDFLMRINNYPVGDSLNVEKEREKVWHVFYEAIWPKSLLQRTLWSLQDFRDGGGLAFVVELFLLALKKLLSTSPSHESYSALYIGTFKAITSDRRRYNHSLGTQKILLDAVVSDQGFLRAYNYPDYITDEFWELLGDMLEGQTGPHINSAVQQLTDHQLEDGGRYGAKALAVIGQLRASCSQGSSTPTA